MARITILTGLLLSALALLIGSARQIGAVQPAPLNRLFANADGSPCQQPCLLGIEPGETSYNDALALLRADGASSLTAPRQAADIYGLGFSKIIVTRNLGDEDQVRQVELLAAKDSEWGWFGQAVVLLGPPQRVIVEWTYTLSYWYGGRLMFYHEHRIPGIVGIDDPLYSVEVYAHPDKIPANSFPWLGFHSAETYMFSAN